MRRAACHLLAALVLARTFLALVGLVLAGGYAAYLLVSASESAPILRLGTGLLAAGLLFAALALAPGLAGYGIAAMRLRAGEAGWIRAAAVAAGVGALTTLAVAAFYRGSHAPLFAALVAIDAAIGGIALATIPPAARQTMLSERSNSSGLEEA